MADPFFRLHNALGSFLGYGGCPLCSRTFFGVDDFDATFHSIEFPSTRTERRDDAGRLLGGDQHGWYPMCESCWAARTPVERMAAMERIMTTRGQPFSAAELVDIREHTLGKGQG